MPYINAEVYIDLADFSDEDIEDEYLKRNLDQKQIQLNIDEIQKLAELVYYQRKLSQCYDNNLESLLYAITGRL